MKLIKRLQKKILSKKWVGHRLGIKPKSIKHLGPATIIKRDNQIEGNQNFYETKKKYKKKKNASKRKRYSNVLNREVSFYYLDYQEKEQYELTFDSLDLQKLRPGVFKKRKINQRQTSEEPFKFINQSKEDPVIDDLAADIYPRERIQPTDIFPYSAISFIGKSEGEYESNCSGALISDRVLLTAAHCVVSHRQFPTAEIRWKDFDVIPGLDRVSDCIPNNESCMNMPFGAHQVEGVLVPKGFLEPYGVIPAQFINSKWKDDIATVLLNTSVDSEAGYFDYAFLSEEELLSAAVVNNGYPDPNDPRAPFGSLPFQMWGDPNYGSVLSFETEIDGEYKIFEYSNQTSVGHSGSPIYQWSMDEDFRFRPRILGVVSHSVKYSNKTKLYARRLVPSDQDLLDFTISLDLVYHPGIDYWI